MLSRKITKTHLLSKGTDWNLLVDLPGHNYVFPPEIYATSERPDIVIWSLTLHQAYIIELTCPAEEGIQTAAMRKLSKYTPLAEIFRVRPIGKLNCSQLKLEQEVS